MDFPELLPKCKTPLIKSGVSKIYGVERRVSLLTLLLMIASSDT
jgi:hypothetical protein